MKDSTSPIPASYPSLPYIDQQEGHNSTPPDCSYLLPPCLSLTVHQRLPNPFQAVGFHSPLPLSLSVPPGWLVGWLAGSPRVPSLISNLLKRCLCPKLPLFVVVVLLALSPVCLVTLSLLYFILIVILSFVFITPERRRVK